MLASSVSGPRSMELADGSQAKLEAQSSAEISIGKGERRVRLKQGTLHLSVSSDPRPFVFEISGYEAVARNARFDATATSAQSTITVLAGNIEVRRAGLVGAMAAKGELVGPGQRVIIDNRSARFETTTARTEMVEFDDVALADAIETINRSGDAPIRVATPGIGQLKLSGAFKAGDTAAFAKSVAAAFSLDMRSLPDGTILLFRPD